MYEQYKIRTDGPYNINGSTSGVYYYFYNVSFCTSNGKFYYSGSGNDYNMPHFTRNGWATTNNRSAGTYCSMAWYYRFTCENLWKSHYYIDVYSSRVKSTTYSKGSTQYTDVTSTSSSTYPSNGKDGNYWYVYK